MKKPLEDSSLHCEACRKITPKHHRFAELLAVNGNREVSYYGAGYLGKAWSQQSFALLKRPHILEAYNFHCEIFSRKTVDWGEELRERERKQSRANAYDLWESQGVESEDWRHLKKLYTQGVEVVEDGHSKFRPPTAAELRKAVHACCELRMKAPHELTYDEQMQAEAITVDGRGKLGIQTARGAARMRSAKLEGLEAATQVKVDVNISMEKWTLAFAAAVAAEALALSQLVEELRVALNGDIEGGEGGKGLKGAHQALEVVAQAVPQLEVRVLGRVG